MDQEERERFGAYLKSLREARRLTQREAAELARISNPYLAQLERGQRNPPSSDILCRLARVYCIPEQKLLQEAGYMDGGVSTVPVSVIERAFDFVCRDEDFSFGTRLNADELSLETKAYIVEVYQKATNRVLLREDELKILSEKEPSDNQ